MGKSSFKKLFLRNGFLMCLLLLGCIAFNTDFSSENVHGNIKILITSSQGLQFSKENSFEGRKIIYDCELGVSDQGVIRVFDDVHPRDMKSLIIENCYELTLELQQNYDWSNSKLQEIKISNVSSLKLSGYAGGWGYSHILSHRDFKVSISNVGLLNVGGFFNSLPFERFTLKLQNVVIDTLNKVFHQFQENGIFNLHLKNVLIKETEAGGIYLRGNSDSILTVENSHFENVHRKAFDFEGTVKIVNNTFSLLDEAAFSVNTSSSFTFSENHVKRMSNPFYIVSSEVNIVNNIFDSITKPWLSEITSPGYKSFSVLNITGNTINHWSQNFFYMELQNFPDVIVFENNYLNCSCKHAITLSYKFQNYITQVFLNKKQKNFCFNLGNCPLQKVLGRESGICSTTFRCPEDDNDDEDKDMWPSHLKSILSVLKNIDFKLDQIVPKYNSTLADQPN